MRRKLCTLALLLVGCQSASPPWSQRKVQLVGLGDSITRGFGASPGQAYFEQLTVLLKARLPNLTAVNYAESTTTSGRHLQTQLPRVKQAPADTLGLVVVTTGGNDLIHNYGRSRPREEAMYGATFDQAQPWVSRFGKRTDQLLDGLNARFPGGVRIFLANIYDPTDGRGDIENSGLPLPAWPDGTRLLACYNEILADRAARRPEVYPVDLHKEFMGHGIHHGVQPYYYYANLEDPNDAGYSRITRLFEAAIEASIPPD
ncbi:SGNH/GDSL hydrolase family protein [bacterium]|nr:SGNH/GDSL hydrolase family protein [bacterium]